MRFLDLVTDILWLVPLILQSANCAGHDPAQIGYSLSVLFQLHRRDRMHVFSADICSLWPPRLLSNVLVE
jgi:hypothetical protein